MGETGHSLGVAIRLRGANFLGETTERSGETGHSCGVEVRLLGDTGADWSGEIIARLGEVEFRSFGVEMRLRGDKTADCLIDDDGVSWCGENGRRIGEGVTSRAGAREEVVLMNCLVDDGVVFTKSLGEGDR